MRASEMRIGRWISSSIQAVAGCLLSVFLAWPAAAQLPPPKVDSADLGLRVPRGLPVLPGEGERLLVTDSEGEPTVAKVFLKVGDTRVVQMPDNRLRSMQINDAQSTDRPFEAADKTELKKQLAERFPGFKTGATRRYVYVYNTSKPFYEATSRILETMYPALLAYCKRQRLTVKEPDSPLVVVMFRTQKEYQAYRSMPAEVVAYYNTVSNYVIMYEQSSLAQTAPSIAIQQSISTIAHEGVHQILHSIGVQQRLSSWPMWISEGVPEFFAPTSTGRNIRWAGVGKANQMRMYSLKEWLKTNPGGIQDGGLVQQTVSAKELDPTGYAMSWALTDYLAKNRREDFFAYLREVSAAKPLDKQQDSVAVFEKHFGNDYAKLQSLLFKHLAKLPYVNPILNQPHYLAVLDIGNLRRMVITSSPAAVHSWRTESLAAAPPNVRASARLNVKVFANRALAEQAARNLR